MAGPNSHHWLQRAEFYKEGMVCAEGKASNDVGILLEKEGRQ